MLEKDDKKLFFTFLAFSLSSFLLILFDDFLLRDFDNPSRFIFVLPVLLFLLQHQGQRFKQWLWYGVTFGSILAFFLSLYERIYLGYNRAFGAENAIIFGNIGVMSGLLNLFGALFFYAQKRYIWFVMSLFGGLCGLGASLLSGSRGGWVALILVISFIFWQSRTLFPKKIMLSIVVLVCLSLLTVFLVPQTGVQNRVSQVFENIEDYQAGEKSTSVGLRFEMWKTAVYMFQESPLIGVGEHKSEIIRHDLVEREVVHVRVGGFSHAHNEYLDTLALKGSIGFIFLMMLYLVPLRLFLSKAKRYENNWKVKPYAIAGAVIPLCYMDFALTQSMFSHNTGVMMYAFPVVYFWAAMRWAEKDSE